MFSKILLLIYVLKHVEHIKTKEIFVRFNIMI
jgi:hypothetical protein